jgi:hypothetical protein
VTRAILERRRLPPASGPAPRRFERSRLIVMGDAKPTRCVDGIERIAILDGTKLGSP